MAPTKEVQDLLDLIESAGLPPLSEMSLDDARASYARLAVQPGPEVAAVRNLHVTDGPHGPFGVRVYEPSETEDTPGCLVWIHGGGFVIGDLETADSTCRVLANEAGVVVVSVDYHLAPEHPYPAAVDDVVTALGWVVDHAEDLGIDPDRLAVGGDSAGGNLAAVACQLARAAGRPRIAYQLLVYPAVDLAGAHPSRRENGEGYFLTDDTMTWFRLQYLGGRDPSTPRVSPLLASDHSRLPPAMVVTAEFDPLRDEGLAYADALEAAGVPVERVHFEGQIHGFFDFDFLPECAVARSRAASALRDVVGPDRPDRPDAGPQSPSR